MTLLLPSRSDGRLACRWFRDRRAARRYGNDPGTGCSRSGPYGGRSSFQTRSSAASDRRTGT